MFDDVLQCYAVFEECRKLLLALSQKNFKSLKKLSNLQFVSTKDTFVLKIFSNKWYVKQRFLHVIGARWHLLYAKYCQTWRTCLPQTRGIRSAAPYNEWYFLFKGILIWLTLIFMRLVLSEAELRNEARLGPETGEVEESGK